MISSCQHKAHSSFLFAGIRKKFWSCFTLFITLLSLPLLPYFGIGTHPWVQKIVYLHPLQPPLLLLQAGFTRLAPWQSGYALVAGTLWLAVAAWAARHAYQRFIVSRR